MMLGKDPSKHGLLSASPQPLSWAAHALTGAAACRFHGKDPSKNKQEKRIRKWEEEQAVKKAAASEQSFAGLATKPPSKGPSAGNVPRTVAARVPPAPYAGQATPALTPLLGGGDTPLQGKNKVAIPSCPHPVHNYSLLVSEGCRKALM